MRNARWVIAALVLAVGAAHADADVTISGTKSTYGTAGCGLGSMIFGDQKGAIQILAATTNSIFGTQTFGITTGTSNCGEAAVGTAALKTFIEGNREALAKDAARGSGETIVAISAIGGCKDSKAVGTKLQRNFAQLFPGEKAPVEEVSQNLIKELRADSALGCRNIG
ncbi:MAG: DUF3015 family protein [Myxococcales bacterium]